MSARGRPVGSKNKPKGHKEPKWVQATMMSWPTLGGGGDLDRLVREYGGYERVAKDFRIEPSLLLKWASDELEVPITVLLSIYWQGPSGMRTAFSESHWANQFNCHRARVAEEKAVVLELALKDIAIELGFDHPALLPVRKLLGITTV